MDQGRIMQEGPPAEIYERPANLFVARFLGAANVLAGMIEARDGEGNAQITLDGMGHRLRLATEQPPGKLIDVVLRPENMTIAAQRPADELNTIPGRIAATAFQGSNVEYEIDIGSGTTLRVLARAQADLTRGTPVWIAIDARRVAVFARS
jgi:ABC-type Fe3+/spermidine/putrescine transport system ATPase subunit